MPIVVVEAVEMTAVLGRLRRGSNDDGPIMRKRWVSMEILETVRHAKITFEAWLLNIAAD